jgi:hydrogenase maturation protease
MNITLIGIGQPLRGDDGVGPEAVRRWSQDFPQTSSDPNIRTVIADTPGLNLLDYFQDADLVILVDAENSGNPAGSVHVHISLPEAGATPAEKTTHGIGVAGTIAIARNIGVRLPAHIIFIGIEGSRWEMGKDFSEPVRRAVPVAAREIQNQILSWVSGQVP